MTTTKRTDPMIAEGQRIIREALYPALPEGVLDSLSPRKAQEARDSAKAARLAEIDPLMRHLRTTRHRTDRACRWIADEKSRAFNQTFVVYQDSLGFLVSPQGRITRSDVVEIYRTAR